MLDDEPEQELEASVTPPPSEAMAPPADDVTHDDHDSPDEGWDGNWRSPRMMALGAGALVLLGIIAADVVYIGRSVAERASPEASGKATGAQAPATLITKMAMVPDGAEAASPDAPDVDDDHEPNDGVPEPTPTPRPDEKPRARKAQTVEQAYSSGCSTSSVDGLSRQIMAEARCMSPSAFAAVPPRKNLVTKGAVFLHLEAPARDQLLQVLDAHPNRTLTINSALRTVAQQYLLDRWARTRRCGIKLAAKPGESNHESGLALDVSEPDLWRPALEKQGFKWLGPSDRVHFDYQGPGAARHEGLDIVAFQRLWNRNHPEDRIAENGAYSEQTEARVKKSPANGFPQGPQCGGGRARAR